MNIEFKSSKIPTFLSALVALSAGLFFSCDRKFNSASIKAPQALTKCATNVNLTDPRKSRSQVCDPDVNLPGDKSVKNPSEKIINPAVADGVPKGFVSLELAIDDSTVSRAGQSSSFRSWVLGLTSSGRFNIQVKKLTDTGYETIYSNQSEALAIPADVKADGYLIVSVESPDGSTFDGVVAPAFGDKDAVLTLDRTSTAAAEILRRIQQKRLAGDEGAAKSIAKYLISMEHIYVLGYASLLVLDEIEQRNLSNLAPSLNDIASGIVAKTDDAFSVSRMNPIQYSFLISESSYANFYKASSNIPTVIAAFKNPQVADLDVGLGVARDDELLNKAYEISANLLRPATADGALIAVNRIPSIFRDAFTRCLAGNCEPQADVTSQASAGAVSYFKNETGDLLDAGSSDPSNDSGAQGGSGLVNNGVLLAASAVSNTITTATFADGANLQVPVGKTVALAACDFTVENWVNLRVAPKTLKVSMMIDNTSVVSSSAGTFKFFVNPDLSLGFERNLLAGGTWKTKSKPAVIALKSWQQVTLMRDGSAIKFLVNGVSVHSEDMPIAVEQEPLAKTSLPWTIGASPSDPLNSGYNGDMEGLQARACPVKTLAKPIFSPSEGAFGVLAEGVEIMGPKDADIFYTTDGTVPTSQSTKFDTSSSRVSVPNSLIINAVAMRKGWLDSPIATANYKINGRISAPMAVPPPGFYGTQTSVSLVRPVDGATIEYSLTTPGESPQNWQTYIGPINVAREQTIHVRSSHPQYSSPSVTASYEYEVPGVVGVPSFNPPNGPISTVTNVKITSETPKSMIYFTTDGSDPKVSSQFIASGGTVSFAPGMPAIRAVAVRPHWQSSSEAQLTGTVAEPVASIPAGYHEGGPLMVRFTTPTLGAAVYYSRDQTEWHEADSEISIASDQTIAVKASKAGYDDSRTVLFDYYFPTVAPMPSFDDDGKSPRNDTKVTVKATYKDNSFDVYCTTDGSIPVVDAAYSCNAGVTITGSSTLKAISVKGLWQTSEVASKNYQMQVSGIRFQIDGENISQGKELNNSKILHVDSVGEPTVGAQVYYTVDGSEPTRSSLVYSNGIQISRDTVVRAIAMKDNYSPSSEITTNFSMKIADLAFYTNDSKNNQEVVDLSNVATVTIRPRDSSKSLSAGMKVYYTTNGDAPSTSSTLYQGEILVGANTTLRAIAVLENYESPPEIRANYKFKNADPVFVGPATFVNTPADVSITCDTKDAVIRYTMNGQDPDANSAVYSGSIRLTGAVTTLAAVAMRDNFAASAVTRKTFKLQAAEPSFDPEPVVGVSFPDVLSVTITSATSNARIYYTTDGTAPSVNSAIYNTPVKLSASGKLRAVAFRDDLEVSASHDRDYVLAAAPPKMLPEGNDLNNSNDFYNAPKDIRLTSDTPGATIYYRVDGKDPVPGKDPVYSSPIMVVDNTQIKAIAVKEGFNPSSITTSDYRILITTCTEPVYACFVGEWICGAVATSNPVKKSLCDNIGFEFDGQDVTSGRCGVAQCASSCQEYYSRTSVKDVSVTPMLLADECPSTLVSQASQVQSAAACEDLQASHPGFMISWDVFIGSSCTTTSGGKKISTPSVVSRAVPNLTPIAAPNPSVASGVYTTTQTLTLNSASFSTTALSNKSSKSASIYYTTDGSPPNSKSELYTGPITIESTTTVKAIAIVVGASTPQTMTATYTITGTVPMLSFSVPEGGYGSAQTVTIIKDSPSDVVYYTVDGSLPTRLSQVYASPLTISTTRPLKAIAVRAGWADSPVAVANYFINGKAATPLVSLVPGAYGASQSVALSSTTSGAVIHYTTDGSTPSLTSTIYSQPIGVASSMTIKAFAAHSSYLDSELLIAPYTINGSVAPPTAVPPAAVYPSARSVELSSITDGAIIYYTVDGSSPLPTSPVYTGPIFVGASQVIRTIAVKDKFVDSAPASFSYTITGSVASPAFDPPEGAYGPAQNVSLSSPTPDAAIYYTTNGSTPTLASNLYTGPIAVNQLTVIKAMAALESWSPSGVVSAEYSINGRVDSPVISVPSGTYGPAQIVTITSATSGSVIHYTQDGSEPSVTSPVYTNPLNIFESKTLKAIATKSGYSNSYVASAIYTINGPAGNPAASVASGLYTSAQSVTLTCSTSNASIYYTLDGSPPTAASTRYTGAFMISESATLKAFANTPVHSDSAVIEYAYTITGTVQTPQFSVSSGAYAGTQTLTLTTSPQDAKIYYTVNGSSPTQQSALYTGPLTIATSQTVSAYAVKTDWADSPEASNVYVINGQVSAPILSLASGAYGHAQTVSIRTETTGATIFYTVNGATPTIDSNIYTGPIAVTSTQEIKAFAVKAIYLDSPVVTGNYTINGPTAKPTATPNGGNFYTAQSVTLDTTTSGANIYYTTDGSTPTADSDLYSGPVFVGVSQTLKAVSVKAAYIDSEVLSAEFNIYGTVQNPNFSVAQGEYGSAQMVGLSSATPGAIIYYTIDGSEPSSSSAVYSGPIAVSSLSSATTIKAYAVKTNWQDSGVSTAAYTINGAVDRPRFSIPGGGYGPTQSVSLTSPTPGAEIYYTLDGVDPTASSARYSVPITVSSSTTLKAFATKQYYADSAVSTAVYTINGAAEPATASLADGTYYGTQSIMLFTPTSGGDLYYTLDGSTPTTNSNYYWSPIVLNGPATLTIITAKDGFSDSAVSTYNYTIYGPLPAPTYSLASGGYGPAQTVAIDSATAGSVIHYTVDGSAPTTASAVYTAPVAVSSSLTIKAIASKSPYPDSAVAVVSYTINGSAAQPVASPAAGSFNTAQAVSLSSSTDGASIFYTLDGSAPTTSSLRYNSAIFVGVSQTIKAIAVKSGYINSDPMSAEYRINGNVQTPIFSVVSGTYGPSQSVTIYSATPGATIYYTTNGANPTTASNIYSEAVQVSSSLTLKAFAVLAEWADSAVTSESYVINGPVAAPVFSVPGGGYADTQTVSLSTTTPGAVIRYTVDGTNPWASSPVYTTPISVSATATIKAYATKDNFVDSSMATASYVISTGSMITVNFSNNQTVIQPKTGGTVTTTILNSMSGIIGAVGANPIARLTLTGTGSFTWDAVPSGGITDVVVNSGATLTAAGYSSGDGQAASLGNGHLVFDILGSLTVNSGGKISMDSLGYVANRSYDGVNIGGAGRNGSGCNSAGAGGYATVGQAGAAAGGAAFGSSDFWSKLYLGSGGGSATACGYDDYYASGGRGGGAIAISAVNINNSGTISARGQDVSSHGGAGSGGTVYLNASGTLSNTGTISAAGGGGAIKGGSGRIKFNFASLGSVTGSVVGLMPSDVVQFTAVTASLNGVSSIVQNTNGITATAYNLPLNSMSSLQTIIGAQNPPLNFSGTGSFTFDSAYNYALNNLSVANGQTVTINSSVTNIRDVTVNAGGVLNINSDIGTIRNLSVYGTVYGPAYSSSAGDGKAATFGNGHLILNVSSAINIYAGGRINMDARGYTNNRSYAGLNLGGAGRTSGCSGTSGSYATPGFSGSGVFGDTDFTTNLYLGSGGGDAIGCWGYDGSYNVGGSSGGGAIFITARDFSNAGTISATGGNGTDTSAGFGSGGTIYLRSYSMFSNSGTISADGGFYTWNGMYRGGSGRVKISYGTLASSTGSIKGMVATEDSVLSSVTVSLNGVSTFYQNAYDTTALGYASQVYTMSALVSSIGSKTPNLNFAGSGTFTFNVPFNKATWDLNVGGSQSVVVNAGLGSLRNVDIAAGGTLSLNSDPGSFTNLKVAGTLTGAAYSSGTGQSPTFGNGRLLLNLSGGLTVTSTGKITMDGKGYSANRSHAGLNLGGAGRTSGCSGGGGSYGTAGSGGAIAGSVFGADDFWSNLYLGSGGGTGTCSGYDGDYTVAGGAGGGAISIAASVVENYGAITALGASTGSEAGAGSGGTIYLVGTKSFVSSGTISAQGGAGRVAGGQGRLKFGYDAIPAITGTIVGVKAADPAEVPIFSQPAGTYGPSVSVALFSATAGASFYYTVDGSTPTTSSTAYNAPIVLTSSATIKAISTKSGLTHSNVSTASYVIDGPLAAPVANPAAGTYASAQAVSLSTTSNGAKIYYTLDGSTPTASSTLYSGQIFVAVDQVIKAIAVKPNYANSAALSASYTMTGTVRPPAFSVAAGDYGPAQIVALTSDTPGATIYYTIDGSVPSRASSVYDAPIAVNLPQKISAFAVLASWNDSMVNSATYTINGSVPTPTFNIPSGTYPGQQSIAVLSSLSGASIYYTVDGSTPSSSSLLYTGPVAVSATSTIKAMASKANFLDSGIAEATYTISDGVSVAINLTSNQTVVTPTSGSASTSAAVATMSGLNALVGANPISSLTLSGTGTFTWDAAPTNGVNNLTINSGIVLTGQPMSSGDGLSPTLGNGHLIIDIRGLLTVNAGGTISMDGRGYGYGLTSAPKQGASTTGSGSGVFNSANGGGGCSIQNQNGSGASYGTYGSGTCRGNLYGAADYWTKLYLGSQGGSGYDCGGYDCFYTIGGAGGGAIKISAGSISSSGKISANGAAGGGGGSGGTIYLYTAGTFQHQASGSITVDGGGSGGKGRIRIEAAKTLVADGTISPAPALGPWLSSMAGQNKVSSLILDPAGSSVVINGVTYKIGSAGSQDGLDPFIDGIAEINVDTIVVQGGAKVTATSPIKAYPLNIILNKGSLTLPITPDLSPGNVTIGNNSVLVTTGTGSFKDVKISGNSSMTTSATQFGDVSVHGAGSTMTVNASATFGAVVADSGATLNLNGSMSFASLNIGQNGTTTITAAGYQSAGTTTSWTTAPAAGNGQLIFDVVGAFTLGEFANVTMDGKGYGFGLTSAPKQGASPVGIGASVFGTANGGGGAAIQDNVGGGGSYGTTGTRSGAGSVYGAADYWTKLYLGSQGGSGYDCGGYDCFYTVGGAGGGAVKITAGTVDNSGKITSSGSPGGAGGSGGTIYIYTRSSFSHRSSGSILANGGSYGGKGRVRIEGALVAASDGVINPAPSMATFIRSISSSANISALTLDPTRSTAVFNGNTFVMGAMEKTSSLNESLDTLAGINIGTLTIQNGVALSGGSSFNNVVINSGASLKTSAKTFGNLTVSGALSSAILNGNGTIGATTVDYGGALNLAGSFALASLSVGQNGTSTVTTNAFTGSGAASGWTTLPSPGNGQLMLLVTGTIDNGPYGVISMDAKGYGYNSSSAGRQGASPSGTGTGIYNMPNGGGGGAGQDVVGSGGSYGTVGGGSHPGNVYGATDFWINLYLGSQGGGGYFNGYDSYYTSGGAGGGAIYMSANSIVNAGRISVDGSAADTGGSGGTIVLNSVNFTNNSTGTLYARGGSGSAGGGAGRIGISYTGNYTDTGTISPAAVAVPAGVPGIPTGLSATAGDQQVVLTWVAPVNSARVAPTDYQIQYSLAGGSWITYSDGVSSATSATMTGLQNNKYYKFRVAAINSGQNGPYSTVSSSVVPFTPVAGGVVLDGSTVSQAAPSAAYIKSYLPNAPDGVYWINLPVAGPTLVYCLMDEKYDGGGWMLMMKATRGTTFNYDASYWTTVNLLNETDLTTNDGDAKFAVMNNFAAQDMLAIWPDIRNGGSIASSDRGWTWLQKDFNDAQPIEPVEFFRVTTSGMNYGGSGKFISDARSFSGWGSGVFSSQADIRFYGFNYQSNQSSSYRHGARVRWGFGWNENGEGLYPGVNSWANGSNDVSGGIGMDTGHGNYSAGDQVSCCQNTTGINRSARVEIYVK